MATVNEVTQMIDWLTAAFSLPKDKQLSAASVTVYVDMLGDIPVEALMAAARIVAANRKFSSFPTIAEIREAALNAVRGEAVAMTAADAWGIAWKIAGHVDPDERDWDLPGGSFDRSVKRAQRFAGDVDIAPVIAAMHKFGLRSLIFTAGASIETLRAQFMRQYEQISEAERKRALLPPKLVEAIENGQVKPAALAANVAEAARRIGIEP